MAIQINSKLKRITDVPYKDISELETDFIPDPKTHEKPVIQNFALHRSYMSEYELMETVLYGGHRWLFLKPHTKPEVFDPSKAYAIYFFDYPKYQKQIETLYKTVGDTNWYPLERLYIEAKYSVLYPAVKSHYHKRFDLTDKSNRKSFVTKNVLTLNDFLRWVLIVANWENITSCKDIVNKFYYLFERFRIFCRLDMTPAQVFFYYNEALSKLGKHNIEPLNNIQLHDYYRFAMEPAVYSISIASALEKLFKIIQQSSYLQGNFNTFKPSFNKFTEKIDSIFAQKYNKYIYDLDCIKRLTEREVAYYDTNGVLRVSEDVFIPQTILDTYSFLPQPSSIKPEEVTESEYLEYQTRIRADQDKRKLSKLDFIYNNYD